MVERALKRANRALQRFKRHQTVSNYLLRSSQLAVYLAHEYIESLDVQPKLALTEYWDKTSELWPILEQYIVYEEGDPFPATFSNFVEHLDIVRCHIFESILVSYLAGFERFLKEWSYSALMLIGHGEAKELASIVNTEHKNVRLTHIVSAFQQGAGFALRERAPLRRLRESKRAEQFYAQQQVSCIEATEMWRQIRNVIVHHEGKLSKMEQATISELWKKFSSQKPGRARKNIEALSPVDEPHIHLQGHHLVYCFTNTYTTVTVLMSAFDGLAKPAGR
jgi:hypothetical protein